MLDANDDWLEEAFPAKYYLMKPNIRELKELFDIKEMITERQLFSLICKLREKGVRNVLLSNGKEGALYFGENEIYKISIPSMKTISTIGSGDCTVAGFCAGINLGLNLEEVLKFSMAWGISNTQHSEGGCIEKTEVGYINAHGTSTHINDAAETLAIKTCFGDYAKDINISSTKSMTGHLLGATGAVEAVASVLALENSFVPPTIGYKVPDEECDLNYTPNKGVERDIKYALSNTLGFGGHNAVLCLKKWED